MQMLGNVGFSPKSEFLLRSSGPKCFFAYLLFTVILFGLPDYTLAAASLWQALPLISETSLSAGNSGGEGCQQIQNFAIDSTGQFLIMGTDVGGVFISTNGGTSWQPADTGYTPRGACAFAIDPNNSDRVLAVGDGGSAEPWVNKYIFPNGELPSLQQIAIAAEKIFVIEDVHNFGADYDKTLMAWHKNFNDSLP